MFNHSTSSSNQKLEINFKDGIQVYIKREDLLHPEISGNKFRKLKYNLLAARQNNQSTLLTFGGAFSNHIAAVAAAGRVYGFKTIGIIRGDELANLPFNPTLEKAQQDGMQFKFISRDDYREKNNIDFLAALKKEFGNFYLIPEGGSNRLAVQGCEEILSVQDKQAFDYVCCAVGTGGTIAGIINSASQKQQVLGFPALKGDFLLAEIRQWTAMQNWCLQSDYHFGGYAKTTPVLMTFITEFIRLTQIPIEPVYTAKMLFGIFDLIEKNYFPHHSKILVIHTGGLQGNLSEKFKNAMT